jgi:hypothetical protein
MSYKHRKWKEIYHFSVWDWQIPDLPRYHKGYSPFSTGNVAAEDTLNDRLERELAEWPGFISKVSNNNIRVRFRNDDSSPDTAIVNLKHLPK